MSIRYYFESSNSSVVLVSLESLPFQSVKRLVYLLLMTENANPSSYQAESGRNSSLQLCFAIRKQLWFHIVAFDVVITYYIFTSCHLLTDQVEYFLSHSHKMSRQVYERTMCLYMYLSMYMGVFVYAFKLQMCANIYL